MGFVKKVWRETRRVVDSPVGAVIMPYTAIGSAALGSKDALASLSSVYVQPVAGYFGGPMGSQIAGAAMSSAFGGSIPTISPTYVEDSAADGGGGGGGEGGGYFSQRGGGAAAAIPSWAWAVGAAAVGLVVVLLLRKR